MIHGYLFTTWESFSSIRDFHRFADPLHRADGNRARTLRSLEQNLFETIGLRQQRRTAFANRAQVRVEGIRKLGLDLDVADLPGTVPRLEGVDFPGVGVERVVIDEHGIPLHSPGDVS